MSYHSSVTDKRWKTEQPSSPHPQQSEDSSNADAKTKQNRSRRSVGRSKAPPQIKTARSGTTRSKKGSSDPEETDWHRKDLVANDAVEGNDKQAKGKVKAKGRYNTKDSKKPAKDDGVYTKSIDIREESRKTEAKQPARARSRRPTLKSVVIKKTEEPEKPKAPKPEVKRRSQRTRKSSADQLESSVTKQLKRGVSMLCVIYFQCP